MDSGPGYFPFGSRHQARLTTNVPYQDATCSLFLFKVWNWFSVCLIISWEISVFRVSGGVKSDATRSAIFLMELRKSVTNDDQLSVGGCTRFTNHSRFANVAGFEMAPHFRFAPTIKILVFLE